MVVYEEGAEGDGEDVRKELGIPAATGQRQKHFLNEAKRTEFTFEEGREYKCDFFNPYVDFNEFALKIGYGMPAISIIGHWDGQPLRYVYTPPRACFCAAPYQCTCSHAYVISLEVHGLTNVAHTPSDTSSRTDRPTPSCLSSSSSFFPPSRRRRRAALRPRRTCWRRCTGARSKARRRAT